MILPFDDMPIDSRIWIYQSDKKFKGSEIDQIQTKLTEFLKNWTAHGDDLKSSFEIKYERFLIIALNEKSTKASGCSIDACVHFIQQIEKEYKVSLLDKMNVFLLADGVTCIILPCSKHTDTILLTLANNTLFFI